MTIEEIEKIISLMDEEKICAEIKRRGFREAGREGVDEFPFDAFEGEKVVKQEVEKEDTETGNYFKGKLYTNCTGYEGVQFIWVYFCKMGEINGERFPVPRTTVLFTDAPVNEEYEREMHSKVKCPTCRKKYEKKELIHYNGRGFCPRCLCWEIKKDWANQVVQAVEEGDDDRLKELLSR